MVSLEETLEVAWSCAAYADRTSLCNSSLRHLIESHATQPRTVEKETAQTGWGRRSEKELVRGIRQLFGEGRKPHALRSMR